MKTRARALSWFIAAIVTVCVSCTPAANLDDTAAHWIKISAKDDGSFQVINGRSGLVKSYGVR